VRQDQVKTRTTRGIQRSLLAPPRLPPPLTSLESKGVVYTKRWVVELLLDCLATARKPTLWMPRQLSRQRVTVRF